MAKRQFNLGDSFFVAAALGMVKDVRTLNFNGLRVDLTASADSDLVNFGPDEYTFPSDAGEAMEIVSDNPADTGIAYLVEGLDENGLRAVETVLLNGTTPVALTNTYSRINFMANAAGVESQGNIDVRQQGGGTVFCQASVAFQRSSMGIYTVPANETALAIGLIPTIQKTGGSDTGVVFGAEVRRRGGVFQKPIAFGLQRSGSTVITLNNLVPDTIEPLTDIRLIANPDVAGVTASARAALLLFKAAE